MSAKPDYVRRNRVEEAWNTFRELRSLQALSPKELEGIKTVFYAGATALMGTVNEAVERVNPVTVPAPLLLEVTELLEELADYIDADLARLAAERKAEKVMTQ